MQTSQGPHLWQAVLCCKRCLVGGPLRTTLPPNLPAADWPPTQIWYPHPEEVWEQLQVCWKERRMNFWVGRLRVVRVPSMPLITPAPMRGWGCIKVLLTSLLTYPGQRSRKHDWVKCPPPPLHTHYGSVLSKFTETVEVTNSIVVVCFSWLTKLSVWRQETRATKRTEGSTDHFSLANATIWLYVASYFSVIRVKRIFI